MSQLLEELFDELFWHSDDEEMMFKFVEAIKYWTFLNKGDVKICLIDISGVFGEGSLYIAFDDCSGGMNEPAIDTCGEFITFYEDVLNEFPELEPEKYWVKKLQTIIKGD